VSLIVEYWLADYLGRIWLRVRGYKTSQEDRSACRVVAHGGTMPAGRLWAVQAFAARTWFTAMVVSVILAIAVAFATQPLRTGIWSKVGDGLLLVLINLALISGAQMGMISYRRNQTSRYVLRSGPAAAAKPSEAPRGLPRRSDFWVILIVALAGSALIFYSVSHPSA
jgi:hypothetical protein